MKSASALVTLACLPLLLASCATDTSTQSSTSATPLNRASYQNGTEAEVKSVDNGNTITVDINGAQRQVRLLNVVAPTENNNAYSGNCLIDQSLDFLEQKLPLGSKVSLNFDKSQIGSSGYLDAAVYSGETLLNAAIVRAGLANTTYTTQEDEYYPQVSQAQQEAAREGLGLYSSQTECSIPHRIKQALNAVKPVDSAADDTAKEKIYEDASTVYNEFYEERDATAAWVGSIVSLDAVSEQLKELRELLGMNYYDADGRSLAQQASASPSGRPDQTQEAEASSPAP